jgi:hypothetical protein
MFLHRIQPLYFRMLLGPPMSIRFYAELIIAFATIAAARRFQDDSSSRSSFLFEHDLFGKPVPTLR